jgi:DNA-binding transcriptional ArsR family regulator
MDICSEKIIHHETVQKTMGAMPPETEIQDQADSFKALGDPGRLKIVLSLMENELCVCDLSAVCGMSESAVSHQLRILRNLRIVSNRREGKIVFYRLNDNHIRDLIRVSREHIRETSR